MDCYGGFGRENVCGVSRGKEHGHCEGSCRGNLKDLELGRVGDRDGLHPWWGH